MVNASWKNSGAMNLMTVWTEAMNYDVVLSHSLIVIMEDVLIGSIGVMAQWITAGIIAMKHIVQVSLFENRNNYRPQSLGETKFTVIIKISTN